MALAEAADRLGVHYMTAYRYVRTGLLAATRHGGRWMVSQAALDAYLADSAGSKGGRPGRPAGPTGTTAPPRITAAVVHRLADRLVAGDQAGAWTIIGDRLDRGHPVDDLHLSLLAPALTEVGDRWASGRISVADEHRATVVASRQLGRMGARLGRRGATRGTVVLTAAPGDHHGLPTSILGDVLRADGLDVVDLGADTPVADLAAMAAAQDRLVGVGICVTTTPDDAMVAAVAHAADLIRTATSVPVLVGGAAAGHATAERWGADAVSRDPGETRAWFAGLGRA
jgi:excisionase family DNA binding protein